MPLIVAETWSYRSVKDPSLQGLVPRFRQNNWQGVRQKACTGVVIYHYVKASYLERVKTTLVLGWLGLFLPITPKFSC